jgi:hypothetical protein
VPPPKEPLACINSHKSSRTLQRVSLRPRSGNIRGR